MTARQIIPRARASRDIDEAIDAYLDAGAFEAARGLVDELQAAYALLLDYPHIGSPRYAHELNMPGLRHWKIGRYPWLVFYIVGDDRLEILRLLDARRDIPGTLIDDADRSG